MKTPISYYGGKQKLVPTILPMIPEHKMYAEPFVGGGAIFFSKPPSHIEVINDTNTESRLYHEWNKPKTIKVLIFGIGCHRCKCTIT